MLGKHRLASTIQRSGGGENGKAEPDVSKDSLTVCIRPVSVVSQLCPGYLLEQQRI